MLELLVIRHGQTDWNVNQKVMGRGPVPLNATGREQARILAEYIKDHPLDAIYTSPVRRTVETAEMIREGREKLALTHEEGLAEIDYGDWVDLHFDELFEKYREEWMRYRANPEEFRPSGGEKYADAFARVGKAVDRICAEHPAGRVALVTHADVVKMVILHVLELPLKHVRSFSIDNGTMILVRLHEEHAPKIVYYNAWHGFGRDL